MGLGSWFRRSPPPMLGVDIGACSIQLVELGRPAPGRWVLECCAMEALEKGCVVDGHIEHFDVVVDTLCRALKQSGSKARLAALALPPTAVITQRLVLPAPLNESALAQQVESEAGRYLPFALDEVCLDFGVMGQNAQSPDDVDVLLVASRRERVEERQALAQAAGLQASVVDIETHAARLAAVHLLAAQPEEGRNALLALVEIGGHGCHLQLVQHGELVFERELATGSVQLTQLFALHQRVLQKAGPASSRKSEEEGEDRSAHALWHSLASEVVRALQFFFSRSGQHNVQQVLVFGGLAALPGMAQTLAQQLQLPVAVANPFEGMQRGGQRQQHCRAQDAPAYMTACGLAMRRFAWC